jgi:hypothetical protein
MSEERKKTTPGEDREEQVPQTPNEGSPGHHPSDDDSRREDAESEQSFPASDPPSNY